MNDKTIEQRAQEIADMAPLMRASQIDPLAEIIAKAIHEYVTAAEQAAAKAQMEKDCAASCYYCRFEQAQPDVVPANKPFVSKAYLAGGGDRLLWVHEVRFGDMSERTTDCMAALIHAGNARDAIAALPAAGQSESGGGEGGAE